MKPWWLQIRLGSKHPSPPYPSRLVRATLISSWTALSLLTGFSLFFPPAQTIHSIFTEQPDSLAPCKRKWDHAAALPETLRRRSSHRGKPSSSRMLTGPTSPALPSDLRSLCSPSQPPRPARSPHVPGFGRERFSRRTLVLYVGLSQVATGRTLWSPSETVFKCYLLRGALLPPPPLSSLCFSLPYNTRHHLTLLTYLAYCLPALE